jgi:lipopolysaccharide transport system permease protein
MGLIMFHMFIRGTSMGLSSISNYANVVGNSRIPLFVLPVAANLTALIMMLIDLSIFFVFMAIGNFWPPATILFLPVDFLLLFGLIIGVSFPLSVLGIRFKDLHYIWNLLVSTLLFVTPIFYKLENMPAKFAYVISLSPWTRLVEMAHDHVLFGISKSSDWMYVIPSVITILIIGYLIFRKLERSVVQAL